MVAVRHFTPDDAGDMMAHYRAVRERLGVAPKPPRVVLRPVDPDWSEPEVYVAPPVEPEPEIVEPEPVEEAAQPEPELPLSELLARFIERHVPVYVPDRAIAFQPVNQARRIVVACAEKHGIRPEDIYGPARNKKIVRARHEAMALVREANPMWSLPRIGRFFGDRDHTTVIHALRKMGVRA